MQRVKPVTFGPGVARMSEVRSTSRTDSARDASPNGRGEGRVSDRGATFPAGSFGGTLACRGTPRRFCKFPPSDPGPATNREGYGREGDDASLSLSSAPFYLCTFCTLLRTIAVGILSLRIPLPVGLEQLAPCKLIFSSRAALCALYIYLPRAGA